MSTPIKIKQETTEVTDARVKLEGVLQNLVDRAESFSHDSDVVVKEEQDVDKTFDDIRELESTPTKKSPSKSRKRRKRDYANSDIEQLDDGLRAQNSYVMKLFDRSVDLAQFRPNAPLYPVCRAWMANSTSAKIPRREQSPSPEPLPDQDLSENGLVYRLPSPSKTIEEMKEEISRDPRIPPATPHPDGPLDINADSSQAPSRETLLNGHIQRWKDIRNDTNITAMPRESCGGGCREDQSSLTPSPSRSPSDGDDALSLASAAASVASNSSRPTPAKKKRAKKTQFVLDIQDEQLMCDFLHKNNILWDIKKTGYRRLDKKAKLWRDQAKVMGKTVEHLQGWFKSVRDTHTRLDKKKSGDGARILTEREQWVKANFSFLKTVVRHRAESMNSVKATRAACSRDLEAAEAACADIVIDDDSTPSSVPSSSSQHKGKHDQEDDPLLQSLQKKVHEFEELLKSLTQPQPVTATAAFANYVRDSLLGMSKRKFRKARSHINTILNDLMDEDSDVEESPRIPTFPDPASLRPSPATATRTSTASEMCQPSPHM